jgi:hypothetical protein
MDSERSQMIKVSGHFWLPPSVFSNVYLPSPFILKCLYQARTVGDHVYLCYMYVYRIYLVFFYDFQIGFWNFTGGMVFYVFFILFLKW